MASASKRKERKVKYRPQKVKLFRSNEPLLSVFMWGVNHTINELSHVNVPIMLLPDDFKAHSKIRVDNHLFNKENMPSHFKVKEYCPIVFRNLRERFEVDENDYLNSLTKQPSEIDSPGRSGARMFRSRDSRYFIKTLVSEEVEQMHHILKQYHQYIVENNAKTLLPQYLGMYRLTVNDIESYLVVMKNIFSPRFKIHKKYDLKGSTVDRQASDKEKAKNLPTYKDNDFVNDGVRIQIGEEAKGNLIATLTKDTEFLASLHLMDYSLIVGIHDSDIADQELEMDEDEDDDEGDELDENGYDGDSPAETEGCSTVPTPPESPQPGYAPRPTFNCDLEVCLERFAVKSPKDSARKEIYFMALIDVLTRYGMKKRTAQAAKAVKHGAGAPISTVRPEQYAKRFLEFISNHME